MKKKIAVLVAAAFVLLGCSGCGGNMIAKNCGGTINIDLPAGEKLTEVTWKNNSLWYLTRPMREGEEAETWTFREKSNSGIKKGKVILKESK